MGVNDAAEMLEVAKEECIRLELENAELRAALDHEREDNSWRAIAFDTAQAECDAAITRAENAERERDALAAVIEQVRGIADRDACLADELYAILTAASDPGNNA